MKRTTLLIALSLCCTLMFILAACTPKAAFIAPERHTPLLSVELSKVSTSKNSDGSTLLLVDLYLTNNSETYVDGNAVQGYATATLGGQPLPRGFATRNNPSVLDTAFSIGPEEVGPGQLVFSLPETEGTVKLKISVDTVDYSGTVEVLNETIELAGVESIDPKPEYDVQINDATIAEDEEGRSLVLLDVSFTNNSDKAISFSSAVDTELFQNDIALKKGYLPYDHPLEDDVLKDNYYTDIKNGATIDVRQIFVLNDVNSPVEIVMSDSRSFNNMVFLEKTIEIPA